MAARLLACALVIVSTLVPFDAHGQQERPAGGLAGRRLGDVLRELQNRGLRVVFSTQLVRPDMRVLAEPRSPAAADQLAELLAPHGLTAESGPGGVIQIVRRRAPTSTKGPRATDTSRKAAATLDTPPSTTPATVHLERLTVTGRGRAAGGVAGSFERELPRHELTTLAGRIGDDPVRAMHALPGVAASDDYRSDISVRGSSYRHASIVVDDVEARWLRHAASGRRDTGTLGMLPADAVESATLQVGPYARHDDGQLGPQLRLRLREGSREARRFQTTLSATTAAALGEGPISGARGSWLVAIRRSHIEWPVGQQDESTTVFGFTDAQAKVVYDVRPSQQLAVTLVGGQSRIEREQPDPLAFGDGRNRAALASIAWRSVLAPHAVLTQRFSVVAHDVVNQNPVGHALGWGHDAALSYRLDVLHAVPGGLIEAGALVRHLRGAREGRWWSGAWLSTETAHGRVAASWQERSGYTTFSATPRAGATLTAGIRLAGSELVARTVLDRWAHLGWSIAPGWRVHAGTGIVHQIPSLEHLDALGSWSAFRPERATQAEVGVSRQASAAVAWDATVFVRRERDALREPVAFAPAPGPLDDMRGRSLFANVLSGSAHGLEMAVARRARSGLAGSVGYAYGIARYTDTERGETFAADFDQRHAVNVTGAMPLPWNWRADVTFRAGTNFPIPGYLASRERRLVSGDRRNHVRLPAYARLDLRAERPVQRGSRHLVFFIETLNVLNRSNYGVAEGHVVAGSSEAVGVTERLFPRTFGGGIRVTLGPATAR
jgi:hypothetical protein